MNQCGFETKTAAINISLVQAARSVTVNADSVFRL